MSFLPEFGNGVCMARVVLGLQPTIVEAYRGLHHPAEQVVGECEKGGFVFAQCGKPAVSAKHSLHMPHPVAPEVASNQSLGISGHGLD